MYDGTSRLDFKLVAQTWMLYMPPSYKGTEPATFVPLHELDWTLDAYATFDVLTGLFTAHSTDPVNVPTGITVSDKGPTSVLPDWVRLILANPY